MQISLFSSFLPVVYLLVSLIEGMYSNTLTVEQWLSRRKIPRKPEEGGVGRSGQAVTDWSQSHSDQSDSGITNFFILFQHSASDTSTPTVRYSCHFNQLKLK